MEGDGRDHKHDRVCCEISIHALRVEGDWPAATKAASAPYFYPRPPGGGRRDNVVWLVDLYQFLSTPSGWKATASPASARAPCSDFYPRPPGGGRQAHAVLGVLASLISIHALRVEGDRRTRPSCQDQHHFYPRPPGGGRPASPSASSSRPSNFYPRPPGGGRQQKRTKFSSVFAQKGEEFASLRRGKRKICRWRFKKDKFWVLIWCEGSGKSVCALASHCG